jgi:hypothetical protein
MTIQTEFGITGRDGYVISEALAIAVGAIDSLPLQQREISDREDMVTILMAFNMPEQLDRLAMAVGSRFGTVPDLSPHDDVSGCDEAKIQRASSNKG